MLDCLCMFGILYAVDKCPTQAGVLNVAQAGVPINAQAGVLNIAQVDVLDVAQVADVDITKITFWFINESSIQ